MGVLWREGRWEVVEGIEAGEGRRGKGEVVGCGSLEVCGGGGARVGNLGVLGLELDEWDGRAR